jgi:large repetitive protein
MLPNGKVLIAGGIHKSVASMSAELYNVGLDFDDSWRPEIASARFSKSLRVTGSLFQGISQASGGNTQDSSSNYPIVQLRRIDNDQVVLLPVDPRRGWSDTSFTSLRSRNAPAGPTLVTVFTNGIPSDSVYLVVSTSQQ